MSDDTLVAWLARRSAQPFHMPASASSSNSSLLHATASDILFACGDAADPDAAAVALLSTMVAQHVEALLRLSLDAASAAAAAAPSPAAGAGAGKAALLENAVVSVLRASGASRAAGAVASALDAQRVLRGALVVDLSAREELAAFALWRERAPTGAAVARAGADAKAEFLSRALADDTLVGLSPRAQPPPPPPSAGGAYQDQLGRVIFLQAGLLDARTNGDEDAVRAATDAFAWELVDINARGGGLGGLQTA
jgi:hypothetical protein